MDSPGLGLTVFGLLGVIVLVAINAYFVATEFALVAVRRTQIELWIKTPPGDPMDIEGMADGIRQLARADRIEHGPKIVKKKGSASSSLGTHEVIIPLSGILDIAAEIGRLQNEMEKLSDEIRVVAKKLANENFVKKAKAEVVDRVRTRKQTLQAELARIEESLDLIRREA